MGHSDDLRDLAWFSVIYVSSLVGTICMAGSGAKYAFMH